MMKNDPWFVYIVKCSDSSLYTGVTTKLELRIQRHNSKTGAKYTRTRTPVTLAYFEKHQDRSSAQKREYEIKQLSKEQKIILCQSFRT